MCIRDSLYQANYEAGLRILDVSRVFEDVSTMREVAYFDTHPASTAASFNGAWNVYPFFDSGKVIVNAIGGGVALVDPSPTLAAQTRTRTVVGGATGSACPLLVQERSCSDAPTAQPAPAPTPRPSLSHAPTSDCGQCDQVVKMEILTDDYPGETEWKFGLVPGTANGNCPDAYATGGPYSSANTMYNELLSEKVCPCQKYEFKIADSYGDGICCDWGSGHYELFHESMGSVAYGGEFGQVDTVTFMTPCDDSPVPAPTPKSDVPPDACCVGGQGECEAEWANGNLVNREKCEAYDGKVGLSLIHI